MIDDNNNDFGILTFSISIQELEDAIAFAKRHNEPQLLMEVDDTGAIGQKISISCHNGSSKVDLTEYDRW